MSPAPPQTTLVLAAVAVFRMYHVPFEGLKTDTSAFLSPSKSPSTVPPPAVVAGNCTTVTPTDRGPIDPLAVDAVKVYDVDEDGVTSTVPACWLKFPTPEIVTPVERATAQASVNRVPAAGAARKCANRGTFESLLEVLFSALNAVADV